MNRRDFLFASLATVAAAGTLRAAPTSAQQRVLVAYFSLSGNTRAVAGFIHGAIGGNLFETRPAESYLA